MKVTDYMPRPGLLEVYLTGRDLVGAEIGVDVGAHAESLLTNCDVQKLYLVDQWDRDYNYGYCVGRLESKGFKHRIEFLKGTSTTRQVLVEDDSLDFIYFDAAHDYETVKQDLELWFPKLRKQESIIGVRGISFEGVKRVVDELLEMARYKCQISEYHNEIIIWIDQKRR